MNLSKQNKLAKELNKKSTQLYKLYKNGITNKKKAVLKRYTKNGIQTVYTMV